MINPRLDKDLRESLLQRFLLGQTTPPVQVPPVGRCPWGKNTTIGESNEGFLGERDGENPP